MPIDTSPAPSFSTFWGALLRGLAWGAAAAAVIGAAVAATTAREGASVREILEAAGWVAMIASFLAIFPVAPIAGVVGWQLFRRGVVAPVAYAAVGAVSAVMAPLLVIVVATATMRYADTSNYAVIADGVAQMVVAGIAAVGAFGGFMAGRTLQRGARP